VKTKQRTKSTILTWTTKQQKKDRNI